MTDFTSVANSWIEFQKQHRDAELGYFCTPELSFRQIAWDKWNPMAVWEVLLDERESYFAHKEILFAGLRAWMILPKDEGLRKSAMTLAALKALSGAEKFATANLEYGLVADSIVRMGHVGPRFFNEIYYVIGGAAAFARCPGRKSLQRRLEKEAVGLPSALQIARVYHHHVLHLLPRGFRPPSFNSTAQLLYTNANEWNIKQLKQTVIKEHWYNHKKSISMVYAASGITKDAGENLLQYLMSGETSFQDAKSFLPDIAAKARYFSEAVLMKCVETDTAKLNLANLPNVPLSEMDEPELSAESAESIRRKFLSHLGKIELAVEQAKKTAARRKKTD